MCPNCQNCGNHVSTRYVRVFFPEDRDVDMCPNCPENSHANFTEQIRKT